jgi:hypothetical protein
MEITMADFAHFVPTLLTIIGFVAIAWYYICIIYVGFWDPAPEDDSGGFRHFMTLSISTLSGTMATFVGMLLGLKAVAAEGSAAEAIKQTAPLTNLQMAAAIAYVVSLIGALIAWAIHKEGADPSIVALGKSFLGLIGGVLAIGLNVAAQ